MTQVPNTTTEQGQREASVMLAKAMGWNWTQVGVDVLIEPPEYRSDPYGVRIRSFYHPSCMQYAWRVLNWVQANMDRGARRDLSYIVMDFTAPPAAAQRAWLDKILELAIEAGLVEAQP